MNETLSLGDNAHGTCASAASAFNTSISIDYIDAIASRNCTNRTFTFASAASNAARSDYICHYKTPPLFFHLLFYHEIQKKQSYFSILSIYFFLFCGRWKILRKITVLSTIQTSRDRQKNRKRASVFQKSKKVKKGRRKN
jgi:hypothetical protein